jgi:hypothetical protein
MSQEIINSAQIRKDFVFVSAVLAIISHLQLSAANYPILITVSQVQKLVCKTVKLIMKS